MLDHLRGNPVADRVFYAATELGDGALVWHLVGAGRAAVHERNLHDGVWLSATLGVESVLVNGIIKSFFRRSRPEWDQPRAYKIRRPRSSSFPSGHASSAFTAAAVLSAQSPSGTPVWYSVATVVAVSRAYVRIHHASDVVAGALTGVVLGKIAVGVWKKYGG